MTAPFVTFADIHRSRLAVFARAVVLNAGGAKYVGETDVPVECGGVVTPGDWDIGDDDGIVVVPAAPLEQAAEIAGRILIPEREIVRQIAGGRDIGETLRCDEVVRRKSEGVFLPQLRAVEGSRKV